RVHHPVHTDSGLFRFERMGVSLEDNQTINRTNRQTIWPAITLYNREPFQCITFNDFMYG
ncbi:MAG: hypothetical protein RR471_09380, partial [Bacteroides sp.]